MNHSLNRIFKVIWSKVQMTWIAVSEITRAHGKQQSLTRITRTITTVAVMSGGAAIAAPPAANQLPTGGQISAGVAAIMNNGNAMTVTQSSNRAAINWNTFDIGSQARVNFVQPSSNAVALNRVNSPNPSQIFGQLSSNGQIYLLNSAGVYFAPGAQVNVGGIVATTHAMSDAAFMAGSTTFSRNGSTGKVINEGTIQTSLNGYIAMLAPEVRNTGLLVAQSGTVALAAGESITLNFGPSSKLESLTVTGGQLDALVENRHAIKAPNGLVILSARAMNQLAASVINSGTIEAKGISQRGGRILLEASSVTNTGTLDVSSDSMEAGTIQINGKSVSISGRVIATSPVQGGAINVQATQSLNVAGTLDASSTGRGGQVQLTASQVAIADGVINADGDTRGGVVEVTATAAQSTNPFSDPFNPPGIPLTVALTGYTSISSRSRRGQGGNSTILGDSITLDGNTNINVSGATGGGNVLVGGDWQGSNGTYQATVVLMTQNASIDASATENGNGGTVVLWSDITNQNSWTQVDGTIRAVGANGTGGQVETSGHQLGVASTAKVDVGAGGNWLLDPADVTIVDGSSEVNISSPGYTPVSNADSATIGASVIANSLNGDGATVNINTINSGTAGNSQGNITISGNIILNKSTSATLVLNANGTITGTGNIGNNGNGAFNVVFNVGSRLGTYGGNFSGSGSLTKRGAGTLVLSGANSFSGSTTVEAGNTVIRALNSVSGNSTSYATLLPNDMRLDAEQSVTANGLTLLMQSEGNLVLYKNLNRPGQQVIWATPGSYGAGTYAIMQGDGNFVVYRANGSAAWASDTGVPGASLTVSNAEQLSVSQAGTLRLLYGSTGTLGNSKALNVDGTFYIDGGTTINVSSISGSGTIWGRNAGITVSGNGDSTFNGPILDIKGQTSLSITKSGNGTLTLAGSTEYSGATNINAGNLTIQSDSPYTKSSGFNGSGNLTIQSTGTSFSSAFNTSGWNFGSSLSGLTIGRSSNTQDIIIANAINQVGCITVYGGNISANTSLTTTGNASGNILLKGVGGIWVASSVTLQTNNSSIALWTNSDGSNNGYVTLNDSVVVNTANGSTTQTAGGGNLVIGGGQNSGSLPTGYVSSNSDFGMSFGNSTAINTGGGSVSMLGCSSIYSGVYVWNTLSLNSGQGAITISGTSTSSQSSVDFNTGVYLGNTGTTIQSAKSSGVAINITGISSCGTGITSYINQQKYIMATGGGDISITASGAAYGININSLNFLASSGSITVNGSGSTAGIYSDMPFGGSNFGQLAGTAVTSSSANVTLNADIIAIPTTANPVNFNTTGNITIQSNGDSFSSAFSTYALLFNSSLSGLTIGKSTNTQNITVFSGYGANISGPITINGGNITLNASLVTTNATTGDISLVGNIAGSNNIALATGRTLTVNQSGSTAYSGCISGSSAKLVKAGSGTVTLTGTNTYSGSTTVDAGTLQIGNGTANGSIASSSSVVNNGTLAFNRSDAVTFSQNISGNGSLSKLATNTLTLTGNNTYSGSTNITAGNLQIGSGGTLGSLGGGGEVNISSGSALIINRSNNITLANAISGTGNLSTIGSNVTTLTGSATYTGTTNVTNGGIAFTNNATPATSGFIGNGTVTMAPNGDTFSGTTTLDYTYASTLKGLTVGNATSTANSDLIANSAINISGPISLYGGNVSLYSNIKSMGSGSAILTKAIGRISINPTLTFQTNNGSLAFWSNANGGIAGGVTFGSNVTLNTANGSASQTTGGGDIVIGGGTGAGSVPVDYASNNFGIGVTFGSADSSTTNIKSGGGNVTIKGSSAQNSGFFSNGNLDIRAGQGAVAISGMAGGVLAGVNFAQGTTVGSTGLVIESSKTTGTAISIVGVSSNANTYGVVFNWDGDKYLMATGGGNISVSGTGGGSNAGIFSQNANYLATTGSINLDGGTTGIRFVGSTGVFGQLAGTNVTSSSANVTLTGDVITSNASTTFSSSGNLTLQSNASSFSSAFSTANMSFGSSLTSLTIGRSTETQNITVARGYGVNISGPISLYGGNVSINSQLIARNSSAIKLKANSGNITQDANGSLVATGLALLGGAANLTNTNNNITTLAADSMGNLTYVNTGNLTIGVVNPTGITATGLVNITVQSGDISLTEAITTTSNSSSAIVLNAGSSTAAGTSTGGNIVISGCGTVSVGSGGRATLFTGSVAGSTGVTALVGSGSGRFRYNSNSGTSNYNTTAAPLGAGINAVYREQPTLALSVTNASLVYGNAVDTSITSTAVNGDTLGQIFSTAPTVSVSGTTSTAGFYTAGNHTLNISASTNILGYASPTITNGTANISKATLTVAGTVVSNLTYSGDTVASFSNAGTLSGVKTNGSTSDVVTLSASGNFSGKNVGSNLTVTMTDSISGADAANYNLSQPTGVTGNITPRTVTLSATQPYSGSTTLTNVTIGNLVGTESLTYSGALANSGNVADNSINYITAITLSNQSGANLTSGGLASNYQLPVTLNHTSAPVTITAAPLTITANSTSKQYGVGATLGTTAFTSSGLANSETIGNVTLASTGSGATADVGSYNITAASASGGTFTASNYNINYVNGSLSVTAAPITLTATNLSRAYGAANPTTDTVTVTSGSLYNGATLGNASVTTTATATTAAGQTANLTPSTVAFTNGSASNYDITYANGSLSITQANLTITANSTSKQYGVGATLGTTAFTSSGLANSETIGNVTLASTGS
ncbi:autotransporter-associated beta strand repeat-containing protein, partial [Polynucleobacter sp. 86C-FISCH]|uniref:two-partner secretion domain-containing protein n=1 Tax=Polynucleobacter sp. 86C-FISCH TaxID=2689101 RepID=UPI001C0DCBF7